MGCDIKITECELIQGSQFNFENMPKIFYNSKIINVIKNKDEQCFIYCYIRKYLNPVNKHSERVSLKDKEFVKKLDELEYNFDNVKIKDFKVHSSALDLNKSSALDLFSTFLNHTTVIPFLSHNLHIELYRILFVCICCLLLINLLQNVLTKALIAESSTHH